MIAPQTSILRPTHTMNMTQPMANTLQADNLEQLRQQFNQAPYPRIPLEKFPDNPTTTYIHSLITAAYRRDRQVRSTDGALILDAGCGTGYKCLELAIANPGARIIGIDLSDTSIELARKRCTYHQMEAIEFHVMSIEAVDSLGLAFDYIDCDETLYLVPDAAAVLAALKRVLKPDGLLRINVHSAIGRDNFLRAQQLFATLGLMVQPAQDSDAKLVQQTMAALKPGVKLKDIAPCRFSDNQAENLESIFANHLLRGDRGWRLTDFIDLLETAGLELTDMVESWLWEIERLVNIAELPELIRDRLNALSKQEQLLLCEIIEPQRLLDVFSSHLGRDRAIVYPQDWTNTQWASGIVHFHPQLLTESFKTGLRGSCQQSLAMDVINTLQENGKVTVFSSTLSACLLPLLESARSFSELVDRWQQIQPLDRITLEPLARDAAIQALKSHLLDLEKYGYVMLETL
jgi:2-polyprenyl-3-methyl-5-hydroxy-6-metoxy-1,4-benzoquinol methylase